MVFSSIEFLFYFLPLVLVIYYVILSFTKDKYTPVNLLLLISSLLFYIKGEKGLVLVMIFSGTVDYFIGLYISKVYDRDNNKKANYKQKIALVSSICINLGVLLYFKYSNFFIEQINHLLQDVLSSPSSLSYLNVTLPLGISFYTFQSMSYTIDIYYKNVKANKNYIDYNCYITMFPQLVAGPIVRYKDIQHQLRNREHSFKFINIGLKRFIYGLAKKVLIANAVAFYADEIFSLNAQALDSSLAWLGAICYALQIYFDFSGYSDMAIGIGYLFGFHFPENFNYPYIAKNIQDFWRRWHISLSSWFRDYLYIPLGGSQSTNLKTYRNLFVVFLLCGLWHGANYTFIAWGIYHGFFLIAERLLKKYPMNVPLFLRHIYCLVVVLVGWVLFRVEDIEQARWFMLQMFTFEFSTSVILDKFTSEYRFWYGITFGLILSTPIWRNTLKNKEDTFLESLILIILLLLVSFSLVGADYNPFIYFRF